MEEELDTEFNNLNNTARQVGFTLSLYWPTYNVFRWIKEQYSIILGPAGYEVTYRAPETNRNILCRYGRTGKMSDSLQEAIRIVNTHILL